MFYKKFISCGYCEPIPYLVLLQFFFIQIRSWSSLLNCFFFSGVGGEKSVNVEEHYRSRENQLQGRILKLSSENAGLLFEIEQIKLDLPRLRVRHLVSV